MKNFRARLWLRFLQTRPNAEQSLETQYDRDRQIATGIAQRRLYLLLALVSVMFELRDLPRRIAIRKAAPGDLAHRSKTSVRVEQVEQGRVSCAKLADE